MKLVQLTASNRSESVKVNFEIQLPETLAEAIETLTEEECYYLITEKAKTIALNAARGLVQRGTAPAEIQRRMLQWTPTKPLERSQLKRRIDISSISDIDFDELLGQKEETNFDSLDIGRLEAASKEMQDLAQEPGNEPST